MEIVIRPFQHSDDQVWVKQITEKEWGSDKIITRGKTHFASETDGFVATASGKPVGFLTYILENNQIEALTIYVRPENRHCGVGTALFQKLIDYAKGLQNIKRIWGITTNDNIEAIKFLQQSSFRLIAIYPNALEVSRKLKPEIPRIGAHGIPLRDEIEIEYPLT